MLSRDRYDANDTIFFAYPDYEKLALQLKDSVGKFTVLHFQNGELHLALGENVKGKNCFILGSITPPEVNLISFLMLSHTLKKDGAKSVVGIIPYLAYSRQEKEEAQKSQMTALIGKLLAASGVDRLITVDIHSQLSHDLFPFQVTSLSPAQLFAKEIKKLGLTDATIVSPDKGAIQRCKDVSSLLRKSKNLIFMDKTRRLQNITHKELQFNVKEKVVIIDDILDTGNTLISCCEKLLERGAEEIIIMVTHGLFTGKKWERLFKLGVKKIYCADTVLLKKNVLINKNIARLSILPILKDKDICY